MSRLILAFCSQSPRTMPTSSWQALGIYSVDNRLKKKKVFLSLNFSYGLSFSDLFVSLSTQWVNSFLNSVNMHKHPRPFQVSGVKRSMNREVPAFKELIHQISIIQSSKKTLYPNFNFQCYPFSFHFRQSSSAYTAQTMVRGGRNSALRESMTLDMSDVWGHIRRMKVHVPFMTFFFSLKNFIRF